ncbi:MAG: hypothetical protein HZB16_13540 [Armatimonadetes bacterium]|nr:hypothetical protein [Armatimonadota bacterium]
MTQVPPRLHVYLAREAPVGVILRRGPARAACLIAWDREHDTFEVGQWVKRRVYEDSCDLSPDGRHFIYVAMTKGETYCAMARVPYFTAIVCCGNNGRWGRGGYFVDSRRFAMPWAGSGLVTSAAASGLVRVDEAEAQDPGHWAARLERSGWTPGPDRQLPNNWDGQKVHWRETASQWRLERISAPFKLSCPWHMNHEATYALWQPETDERIEQPDWTWADWDRNRIVWAAAGCLWTTDVTDAGLGEPRCLHDFNGMTFAELMAPYEGVPRL